MDAEIHNLVYKRDGKKWFCHRPDFVDLQNSPSGFGFTREAACADLLRKEAKDVHGRQSVNQTNSAQE